MQTEKKLRFVISLYVAIVRKSKQMPPFNPFRKFMLFNANSAIFQLYHGENKLIFNEIMMRSALY